MIEIQDFSTDTIPLNISKALLTVLHTADYGIFREAVGHHKLNGDSDDN
jgi:hypothetical protein